MREYSFVADVDSLEALRRLRRGWAGWEVAEGEFRVRLREGGTVRAHVDALIIEEGLEVACLVADYMEGLEELPARDSDFTSHGNDIAVFRGVTWLERRPELGPDHSIQFSGHPGIPVPESAVSKCDFTDAFVVTAGEAQMLVRLALRPGWLEVVEEAEEVEKFLELRGFTI